LPAWSTSAPASKSSFAILACPCLHARSRNVNPLLSVAFNHSSRLLWRTAFCFSCPSSTIHPQALLLGTMYAETGMQNLNPSATPSVRLAQWVKHSASHILCKGKCLHTGSHVRRQMIAVIPQHDPWCALIPQFGGCTHLTELPQGTHNGLHCHLSKFICFWMVGRSFPMSYQILLQKIIKISGKFHTTISCDFCTIAKLQEQWTKSLPSC